MYTRDGNEGSIKKLRRDPDQERLKKHHGSSSLDSSITSPISSTRVSPSARPRTDMSPEAGGSNVSASSRFTFDTMGQTTGLHQHAAMLGLHPSLWGSSVTGPEMLPPIMFDPRAFEHLHGPLSNFSDHHTSTLRSENTSATRTSTTQSTESHYIPGEGHTPLQPPPPYRGIPCPVPMMSGIPPYHLAPGSTLPGILPPNTLMTPYPFIVPFPVPIPIPIPIKEKLFYKYLKKANETKPDTAITNIKSEKTNHMDATSLDASNDIPPIVIKPRDLQSEDLEGETQCECVCEKAEGSIECAKCFRSNNRDNSAVCEYQSDDSMSPRSSTSNLPRVVSSNSQDDMAMDLSKVKPDPTSYVSPRSTMIPTGNTCKPLNVIDQNRSQSLSVPHLLPVMRMHPGFHTPVLPIRELPYSSRRALLLDAPSVQRDSRDRHTPSPEKGIMFRSPSRELVLNKRKCGVRPRIKSK